MKLLNVLNTSVIQIISLIFVVGYLLGVLNIHFSDRNNYCEMTYMYEYPQFVHITVEENSLYPQYGLYAYSEGRFTERARKMWFDGIPVLFLPGNSGSHMQVRSLASVALRKALSKGYDYHFDFFTINYNNEYSGLYGGVLESQTKFAAICINRILSLYKYTKSIPTSVIVIGHSMGGVIAKRLMTYSAVTSNTTNLVIALAAPLQAPAMNFDFVMNSYYFWLNAEWELQITGNKEMEDKKMLISIGSGPRDVLVPAGLTYSPKSSVNALTTAIPGVWVSPDHVSMVWCKQLVMVINRYLFDIIDPNTHQLSENKSILESKALQYFQANRSVTLNPKIVRSEVPMIADAFWYEDNRRIYQISRPSIDRQTYLMIRLVKFPQNRFVAIESINLDDKEWIFGCNAMYTYSTYRYCKHATPIGELSRWTGAAKNFGRRKLATIHLHSLMESHPNWTHVIVKVSPTRKPVVLNVDISDHSSRRITVDLPSTFSFGKRVVTAETEPNSLYYELVLPGFIKTYQAYLLYVEPTQSCPSQYHVSAELHVPWAKNHDSYHYFTHLKKSPMKLRLFKSNPHLDSSEPPSKHVKITLLLDPQCTFKISIAASWYHQLSQFVRLSPSVLVAYVGGIILLAARNNVISLKETGTCMSIHKAIITDILYPFVAVGVGRFALISLLKVSMLYLYIYKAGGQNNELLYFMGSILVLPAYVTAVGIVTIWAAVVVAIMVFSSQLAHRLLFRLIWRGGGGGGGLAEHVASGLKRVPLAVSSALMCITPLSCGAAALALGTAFYAFLISKMYEEYLEDYFYKLMARIASRICLAFKPERNRSTDYDTRLALPETSDNEMTTSQEIVATEEIKEDPVKKDNNGRRNSKKEKKRRRSRNEQNNRGVSRENSSDIDDDLTTLNFHMTLFFMWMVVAIMNIPVLLTWARNFKYSMSLEDDKSYYHGVMLSIHSIFLFQLNPPRKNLKHSDLVAVLLCIVAFVIIIFGPFLLAIVTYGVSIMLSIILAQQMLDTGNERIIADEETKDQTTKVCQVEAKKTESEPTVTEMKDKEKTDKKDVTDKENPPDADHTENDEKNECKASTTDSKDDCDVCSESRIYNVFKNLREKFNFSEE